MKRYDPDDESTFTDTEAGTVAGLAWAASSPNDTPTSPAYVVVPEGATLQDLEALAVRPWRPRALVSVADVASLVAYIQRHGTTQTAIFANDTRIVGVLNFRGASDGLTGESTDLIVRGPGKAGHGDDVVAMRYAESPEWQAWAGVDGKRLTHALFAEWLEDHLPEVVEPSGAELLEIAKELQVRRDVEFRSAVRLTSGAQSFNYQENDAAGAFSLPPTISLGIPPFEGSPKYRLEVRIRYRLEAGKLSLWFARVRPDLVLRAEREQRIVDIREGLPGVPVYLGTPNAVGVHVPRDVVSALKG